MHLSGSRDGTDFNEGCPAPRRKFLNVLDNMTHLMTCHGAPILLDRGSAIAGHALVWSAKQIANYPETPLIHD